jgi:CrcB protein
MNYLLIAFGGGIGSVLRYACSKWLNEPSFPYGTLSVNIVGSFLIGLLWALFASEAGDEKQLLLITGFCGGFTTLSAFSLEGLQLLQQSKFTSFFLYTFATIFFGIAATFTGFKLIQS